MTTRTTHHIDGWTYTLIACPDGQALADELDEALSPVRMWTRGAMPLTNCPHCNKAGDAIKRYFRHLNECSTCRREWEVRA